MARHLEYPSIPFHELLSRAAKRWPEKTAVVFQDRRLSFAELDHDAGLFAHALLAMGIQPGDRVALFMPNCPEYVAAFFGACRAAAAPSPLNPAYKSREALYQLSESGASVLIVHPQLWPIVAEIREQLPGLRDVILLGDSPRDNCRLLADVLAGQPAHPPVLAINARDLAALPFSSGTTGASKGVMLTQTNLVANAYQFSDATGTTERDRLLIFLPLYHIYGVALMALSVLKGATQVLLERFDLNEVVRLLGEEQISELFVVPPVMLAFANAPGLTPEQFAGLRFLMSAAAPLAPEVARRVADRLRVPVIQAYGMTESSPLTHMVALDDAGRGIESVGAGVADTECRIMDLELGEEEVGMGVVGEVTIAGPQIMDGYWNAPAETARALRNGWLYTGDVGKVDKAGNLYLVDRKKEMIKYKAFSIAPAELEALLLEHPGIRDCAVTAQPDSEAGEVPCAFVVLRSEYPLSAAEVQAFVAEHVATYKQIRSVHIVDAIPRTPSGKILRRVLREQV